MSDDIEVWKQRNEILHKKVERLMEELRQEHEALTERFAKEHGRAWWIFCSTQQVEKFKDQWIINTCK